MIETLKMKNCATYSSDGALIENCQKVNLFYGPNGSGKSTIGNFLLNPENPLYGDCEIVWENNEKQDIVVYNRQFKNENIRENIPGVFTLGKSTIDENKNLEELKNQRDIKRADYSTRKETVKKKNEERQKCENKFRDDAWEKIFKQNNTEFQEAFSGFRNNKEHFCGEVLRRYNESHLTAKSKEELKAKAKILYLQKPVKCELISCHLDDLNSQIANIEVANIWEKVVVGNKDLPIGKLIETLKNADWVNQGRKYLLDDEQCPFCQQNTISKEFRQQLNVFFSGEYEQDVATIKGHIEQYTSLTDMLYHQLDVLQNNLNPISQIDNDKLSSLIEILKNKVTQNKVTMQTKEKEPSRTVSLIESSLIILEIQQMIIAGNDAITEHNKIVDNYTKEKESLTSDIWTYLMNENVSLISDYLRDTSNFSKAIDGINYEIKNCEEQLTGLNNKIIDAEKNITSVQPTVDEINHSLESFGFTNFKLVSSQDHANAYQIQRNDGTLATDTLSEGEETFITFLYFMQLEKGSVDESKISSQKILVLDDPVCSLDNTVLYIVSSLIKGLIHKIRQGKSDVKQIFIFTHNVFFHKEVSFMDRGNNEFLDTHFWIINKDNNATNIKAYETTNPIKSSYDLLWEDLRNNSNASFIATQNNMRKILENYFRILGKKRDTDIINKFPNMENKNICSSLLSWINDGSHSIPDDLYIDSYTDSKERYLQVFKEIFVNMGHESHYNMMMGIDE